MRTAAELARVYRKVLAPGVLADQELLDGLGIADVLAEEQERPSADLSSPFAQFDHPDCWLFTGDCRDVLPELPDESIVLVITDPPYNIGLTAVKRHDGHINMCVGVHK
jgi:hypothetical protein